MSNTYTKLKDGSWGIKVEGKAVDGQNVAVTTKAGKDKNETIKRVLWTGKDYMTGRIVSLCAIHQREYANSGRTYDNAIERRSNGNYCGYPCPVTGRICSPKNGPCHDCQ